MRSRDEITEYAARIGELLPEIPGQNSGQANCYIL